MTIIQIDEIGVLHAQPVLDAGGDIISAAQPLPGWHVNATHPVAGWDAYRVTPASPRRVFGGAPTVHYTFDSQADFAAALAATDLNPAIAPAVPAAITMRQARLALLGAGLLSTVNAAIAAMPGAQGEAARIEWEFSSEVKRAQPLVSALGPALGLTGAHLDALFLQGEAL